jgi:hypothetical protein
VDDVGASVSFGSSRFTGEGCLDLEEEVVVMRVVFGNCFD